LEASSKCSTKTILQYITHRKQFIQYFFQLVCQSLKLNIFTELYEL